MVAGITAKCQNIDECPIAEGEGEGQREGRRMRGGEKGDRGKGGGGKEGDGRGREKGDRGKGGGRTKERVKGEENGAKSRTR